MEWKFSRARMWLEWIDKGNTLPAPLNIVYYILYLVVVQFWGKCLGRVKEKCPCCEGNKVRLWCPKALSRTNTWTLSINMAVKTKSMKSRFNYNQKWK